MPTLPYITTARLVEQGGAEVLPEVPVSIWPGVARVTHAGEAYDATAQAPLTLVAELSVRNRSLVVDGTVSYKIVSVQPHEFLPHLNLQLRRMKA